MKGPFVPHILEKQLRFFRCLAALVPALIALAIALLLARSSQLHEVLLRMFEGELSRDLVGLIVFAVLCLLLGTWDYNLSTRTKDREYKRHANPYLDKLLARIIAIKAVLIVMLPFVGLIWGLLAAWQLQSVPNLKSMQALVSEHALAGYTKSTLVLSNTQRYWLILAVAATLMCLSAILIAVVHRKRIRLLAGLLSFNLSLGAAAILAAWLLPDLLARSAITAGALSMTSLIAMGILTVGFALTSQYGISMLAVLVSAAMAYAAYSVPGTAERKVDAPTPTSAQAARPGEDPTRPGIGGGEVRRAFEKWLEARDMGQTSGRRDPVFIFALPGGGIYAASAAGTLLATLQDRCPGFSRHVFAISAVSGGAVGTSIFNSIASSIASPQAKGCTAIGPGRRNVHSDLVKKVVLEDHLAPVGAFILPDLLRKVVGLFPVPVGVSSFDRAWALEYSMKRALAELRVEDRQVPADGPAATLFNSHWTASSPLPALVLNTTWVETGHRVAFAPFPLKHVGDGTLYSFKDELFRGNKVVNAMTVLQAGVVSARFPGVTPAWQLADLPVQYRVRGSNEVKEELRTLNFVDGGYADNSGTLTAYDIYAELQRYIDEKKLGDRIDLRLVVLSEKELDRLPDGTRYTDTIAPISALLNIRNRGLVEVVGKFAAQDAELKRNPDAHITARSGKRSGLLVMRLNQDDFPLTLGWTISEFRNSTIRLQFGEPELCEAKVAKWDQAKDTIIGNSCIQREIFRLLGGR